MLLGCKEQRIIALGAAYVEARIQAPKLHLPQRRNQLPAFLDSHPEATLYAGGSVPNIISSFIRLSDSSNVRLFCCVGNDDRGRFFTENIDQRLGKPKISSKNPTGVWVGVYNNGLTESFDFYGAADDITVSRRELRKAKNEVFISDIDFITTPHTLKQVQKVLRRVNRDNGAFALSLGHVGHNPSVQDQERVQEILSSLSRKPDLVFGNEYELLYISGKTDINDAIRSVFPDSKLLIVTQAEKGAIIRYNGRIISVPAVPIANENVVDSIGAGDTFMGVALAMLMRTTYNLWNENNVAYAVEIASYAASLIIQSMHSHLTQDMAQQVLAYRRDYVI